MSANKKLTGEASKLFKEEEKKLMDCCSAEQKKIKESESKCSDHIGSGMGKCCDFDKALVFVKKVSVSNVTKVDFVTKNDLYVELCFQTQSDPKPEHFSHVTEVQQEAGMNASWETWKQQVHFSTSISQIKKTKLSVKVFDKNSIMSDVLIGSALVALDSLLNEWDTTMNISFEFTKSGTKMGQGVLELYIGAPFNWLTCGLHAPKLPDCSCHPDACGPIPCFKDCHCNHNESCCNKPHCFNCSGCCLPGTCGTCHLPSDEKCCSCHAPACTICNCTTPSCANLCGVALCDCCAGVAKGTAPKCVSTGKCGLPTFSFACPVAHWGDCGGPCKCDDGHCQVFPCLTDLTCNGCEEGGLFGEPLSFQNAHVHITSAKIFNNPGILSNPASSTKNPLPIDHVKKDLIFKLEFGKWNWDSHDHGCSYDVKNGNFGGVKEIAFLESSNSLNAKNLIIKILEKKNTFGHHEEIGSGDVCLATLLHAGYHNEIHIGVPIYLKGSKPGAVWDMKVEIGVSLQSSEQKPKPIASGRTSMTGGTGKKRTSIVSDRLPDIIARPLTPADFEVVPTAHISKKEATALLEKSLTEEDCLIGYQIELISRSTRMTKGTWVIMGIRKFMLFGSEYLLKNDKGSERWIHISKTLNNVEKVAGKPIEIHRRVASL